MYGTRFYVPIMYTLCTPLRQVHNHTHTHTHTLTTNHSNGVKATATATATLQPSNRKQPVSRAVYTHTHTHAYFNKHCTHTRTAHLTQPERTAREGAFGKASRRRRRQRRQQRQTYALANEPNLIEHSKNKNKDNNNSTGGTALPTANDSQQA